MELVEIKDLTEDTIESTVQSLDKKEYLRPGRKYNDFIKEFSNVLGRAREDATKMSLALFNMALIPVFELLLQMLIEAHGKRLALLGDKADVEEIFDERMPLIDDYKFILGHFMQFIVRITQNPMLRRNWEEVLKGSGDMDSVSDVVALVETLVLYPQYAQLTAPRGVHITAEYLEQAKSMAMEMSTMYGQANASGAESLELLDRRRRLMTLCVMAERWVKLYASMAFADDMEHYNKYYASPSIRRMRSGSGQIEADIDMDAVDAEIDAMEASANEPSDKKDVSTEK